MERYELLCRDGTIRTPKQSAQLHCRYVTNKSAFLKIAPFKLEEVNLKPYIVIYHEVLYESEMKVIKELAKPNVRQIIIFYCYKFIEKNFHSLLGLK